MKQLFSRRISATLLAAGLLLSACGQSDASGRVRNSSVGEGCFPTQADKDIEIEKYEILIQSSTNAESSIPTLEKELQEQINKLQYGFVEGDFDLYAAASAKVKEINLQLTTAKGLASGKENHSVDLAFIEAKPVCESPVNNIAEETPDSTPDQAPSENSTPDGSVSAVSSEACKEAVQIPGGPTRTISVGETLELEFLMCSNTTSLNVFADQISNTNSSGTTIYLNMVEDGQSRKMIVRFTGTTAGTEKFYFQQVELESGVGYPLSSLDLTVVDPTVTLPCDGLIPNILFRPEGFTFSSDYCDEAEAISLAMYRSDDGSFVLSVKLLLKFLSPGAEYKTPSLYAILGTDEYDVVGQYQDLEGRTLGKQLTRKVQFKESEGSKEDPVEPSGTVELPPVLSVDDEVIKDNEENNQEISEVSPTKVVLPADTRTLSCADACLENVVKQSGIEPTNVESIEVSINGSEWLIISPETTVPLIETTSNVVVRVTPKDGSKPVALTSTLYRDATAVNTPVNPESIAVSVGGEQTITAVPETSGSSSAQIILMAVVVVILLLLALLFLRSRRNVKAL